jgi:ribosomal-protein-alanine N-acetyltransferase
VSGGPATALESARARDLVVVPLAAAHLDQVLAIEAQVATTGWSREIFERELAEHASRCYLAAVRPALHGPVVVGYAGMQVLVDEAHITTMAVAAPARRRGVATRLLVELLREARARGAVSATLEVRVDNRAARALYAGFGFRPVDVRPRYYDGAVDALIMWAHDIDGAELGRLLRARDPLMDEGERQRAGGRGSDG